MILVIPVFVPHAGCPHNCTFCNQKTISGEHGLPTKEDVITTIELYRAAAERYDEVQLAFYGGSFTATDDEIQESFLQAAFPYLKRNGGFVDRLRCSTRPDAIDTKVIERLKKYGLEIVELGAQSMDDSVLLRCERGHDAEATKNASKLLKENGFKLGIQTMTGLPGATIETDLFTADEVIKLKPDFVRIYPTVTIKNTKMAREYEEGKYKPQTLDEAVELCAKLCEKYEAAGIDVARIGLQSTDTISTKKESEIVAGPYHEAFGGLVKSFRYLERINKLLKEQSFGNPYILNVYVPKKDIPDAVGHSRGNEEKIKKAFGFKHVNVKPITEKEKDKPELSVTTGISWRSKEYPGGISGETVDIILNN